MKPMKDYVIDYTWRVFGKEVVNCPKCRKHGVLRRQLHDNSFIVVHRESPRMEDNQYYQEFCSVTEPQAREVLRRKEAERVYSLERNRRRKLKDREILT